MDSPKNAIGGTGPNAGNSIFDTTADPASMTGGDGIDIEGAASTGNTVVNNIIESNAQAGVAISNGASGNIVGSTTAGNGNTVIKNGGSGIVLVDAGTSANQVMGNRIGIDDTGAGTGNTGAGILINRQASGNIIGGSSPGAGNIISDNLVGIQLQAGAANNTIFGNDIGTALDGSFNKDLGNGKGIVSVVAGPNPIGGATETPGTGAGNKIVGNGIGVEIRGGTDTLGDTAQGDVLKGNEIAQNTSYGIEIDAEASGEQIGGADTADANSIHDNVQAGVFVQSGTGNSILHNPIYDNGGLGIDLAPEGPGSGGTSDANNRQSPPVLTWATTGGSHLLVGNFQGAASTTYTVEFFVGKSSQFSDDSEDDDAETLFQPTQDTTVGNVTHIGPFLTLSTNAGGTADFDVILPADVTEGVIRATVTDPSGNTSEFSSAVDIAGDSDGDGVPDSIEAAAPNGDSSNQPNVASFPSAVNAGATITLVAPMGTQLQNVQPPHNPSPGDAPPHTVFPFGFVDFTVTGLTPGQHVAVEMILPGSAPSSYWRYGATPQNLAPHWYNWLYNASTDTGAEINGNTVILHFVDGERGDEDLAANGTIVDAGGPGFGDPFTVTNTADSGAGSLRQAITSANANPGQDDITFAIGGPGPYTIQPLSALPAITDSVIIDGLTEPPSEAGYAIQSPTPLVTLDGSLAGPGTDGLVVTGGVATIKGLVINRFAGDGIHVETGGAVELQDNEIGTDLGGTLDLGNGGFGVEIVNNTASNNDDDDDDDEGPSTPSSDLSGNLISANAAGGVFLHGIGATDTFLEGNRIGTQIDGQSALGNSGPGVVLDDGANSTQIGTGSPAQSNTIAFNLGAGVEVLQSRNDLIRGNSIFANTGIAIDLGGAGADDLQTYPVLTQVASYGGMTTIAGTLTSQPELFYDARLLCGPHPGAVRLGFGTNLPGLGDGHDRRQRPG